MRTNASLYAIKAPQIFDGEQTHYDSALLIRHNEIETIVAQSEIPLDAIIINQYEEGILIPGFIDLQVNGGGGVLFNNDPTLDGLKKIISAHQVLGTHAIMPTLITADDNTIINALNAVEAGIAEGIPNLLGIHLEGPMLNPKRKGIHSEGLIRTLSPDILEQLTQHNYGRVLITVAPEMIDLSLILELTNHGFYLFAGHTEAKPDILEMAIDYGLRGFTHLYNAMPQMESRAPNTTGFAIMDPHSYSSIINDGLHIDPMMVKLAYRAKERGKLFFVSDAMASIGSSIESFHLDDKIIYQKEGRLIDKEGTLAGAHLSLSMAVNRAIEMEIPFYEAIKMASLYPANSLNLTQYGRLSSGSHAFINHYHEGEITPLIME